MGSNIIANHPQALSNFTIKVVKKIKAKIT
jgi:hypothetical protein